MEAIEEVVEKAFVVGVVESDVFLDEDPPIYKKELRTG